MIRWLLFIIKLKIVIDFKSENLPKSLTETKTKIKLQLHMLNMV